MSAVEIIYVLMLLGLIVLQVIRWHVQLSAQQARAYLNRWEEDSAQVGALVDAALDAHDAEGCDEALGQYRVISKAYVEWFKSRR